MPHAQADSDVAEVVPAPSTPTLNEMMIREEQIQKNRRDNPAESVSSGEIKAKDAVEVTSSKSDDNSGDASSINEKEKGKNNEPTAMLSAVMDDHNGSSDNLDSIQGGFKHCDEPSSASNADANEKDRESSHGVTEEYIEQLEKEIEELKEAQNKKDIIEKENTGSVDKAPQLWQKDQATDDDRTLLIKLLDDAARIPTKESEEAGFDLTAVRGGIIPPKTRKLVGTGIAMTAPKGTYGRIAPRSGLASKRNVDIGAGVIDRDYNGEVMVLLINNGDTNYEYVQGERVAQLIIGKYADVEVRLKEALMESKRGNKGFGSTGAKTKAKHAKMQQCHCVVEDDDSGRKNSENMINCFITCELCNKDSCMNMSKEEFMTGKKINCCEKPKRTKEIQKRC